jgi:hypothetical protein
LHWLTVWWRELFRDIILTLTGVAIIYSQVYAAFTGRQVSISLLGTGLALTAPATYVKLREHSAASGTGGPGLPSPPRGPELPQPSSSGGTE